jgi:pyridoxamine 5'-phosphate oxidase
MAMAPRLVQQRADHKDGVAMTKQNLTQTLFDDASNAPLDPFAVFEEWFAEAVAAEPNDPHAIALASVDAEGNPDVRMVLLNARDQRGFCFFTNLESDKGIQLLAHPSAAFVIHWKSLRRQIRVRGPLERVSEQEADAYFATRHRTSQLGAHASLQSRPLASRAELAARVDSLAADLGDDPVPRPAHWSGFRLVPRSFEFWKDGAYRLHDRVRFTPAAAGQGWTRQRLHP